MKKRPIVTAVLFCVSILLFVAGLGLTYVYGDTFQFENASPLMIATLACLGVSFIVFGIAFAFLLFPLARPVHQTGPVQLDERQVIVSGKGAEYGLATTAFAALGMYLWESAGLPQFAEPGALLIIVAFLGIFVYLVYRIWNGAYFAVNRDKKSSVMLTSVLVIILVLNGSADLFDGGIIVDGLLTKNCMVLVFGILGLLLLAVMGIKTLKDRKDEDE